MQAIAPDLLQLLCCPDCQGPMELGAQRLPTLECGRCSTSFAVMEGILDLTPKTKQPTPGIYRTKTLANIIAGVYDVAAPLASLTTWGCSPLRYIDATNTAVGRANGGVLVEAPIGTGLVLERSLAPYHNLTILGFDSSWQMLRQAQRRFAKFPNIRVLLVHCDLQAIPLRDRSADAVQSLNGLHSTVERIKMLNSFGRIAKPGAHISGTALIRGEEFAADFALNQLEKWGIVPFLRTSEFLVQEIGNTSLRQVHFTTFGAVLFWNAISSPDEKKGSLCGSLP